MDPSLISARSQLLAIDVPELPDEAETAHQQSHLQQDKRLGLDWLLSSIYLRDDLLLHQIDTHGWGKGPFNSTQ